MQVPSCSLFRGTLRIGIIGLLILMNVTIIIISSPPRVSLARAAHASLTCPAGVKQVTINGQHECNPCPTGTKVVTDAGKQSCSSTCLAGAKLVGYNGKFGCSGCPAGAVYSATGCNLCSAGAVYHATNKGEVGCTLCPAGLKAQYSGPKSYQCVDPRNKTT